MSGNENRTALPVPLLVPASNACSPYDKSLPRNSPRREQFSSMPYHEEYISGFPSPRSYSMDAAHHRQALSVHETSSFFAKFCSIQSRCVCTNSSTCRPLTPKGTFTHTPLPGAIRTERKRIFFPRLTFILPIPGNTISSFIIKKSYHRTW